jgi:tripartite-type tricarboxylate transporter receptor subunit TctC
MHRNSAAVLAIATAVVASTFSVAAQAQAYPTKPVRIVVPYPPGGIDPYLRIMMPKMTELMGQPIVLENRPGANGLIGTEVVVRSPADGYTLLFATTSTLVGGTLMIKAATVDPIKDLTPIVGLFESLRTITVSSALPVTNVRELIDYARANPGKLSFGSSGVGSAFHLDGEIFKEAAGIDIVHVPYKGSAPMATAITSGEIAIGIASYNNIAAAWKGGKVRLIAIMERKRSPLVPDVPTLAETLPGAVKSVGWTGILGPAGLPRPIVNRWHAAAKAAMETPDVIAYHRKMGTDIDVSSPEDTAESLRAGLKQVSALMKKINLQPE